MNVLLNLYTSFEEYALKAFNSLLKHRSGINNEFRTLLELHEEDADGKERLMFTKILKLARSLPEPFKAQENLKKFVAMFNDKTLFGLLKVSTDVSVGCGRIKKAVVRADYLLLCLFVCIQYCFNPCSSNRRYFLD